jgi:hypothetical protein
MTVRDKGLGLLFFFAVATDASACVLDASFFRNATTETLTACLQGPDGGAFLSERDAKLATVLHLAVETGKDPLVFDAIRRAAGDGWPEMRERLDNEGRTALHLATGTTEAANTVRWLLSWGAKPDVRYEVQNRWNPLSSDYGITPLHLAAERSDGADTVSALLAGGADAEIARPINTAKGTDYWTATLVASRYAEDFQVLAALAAGGADLNAVANDGNNALHIALAWDRSTSVIHFLIEMGVETDATNDEGQKPLHLGARFSSSQEIVALLLDATDDICAADNKERTPSALLKLNETLAGDQTLERRFHEICVEGN